MAAPKKSIKDFSKDADSLLKDDLAQNNRVQLNFKHKLDSPNMKHTVSVSNAGKVNGLLSQTVKLDGDSNVVVSLNLDGSVSIGVNATLPTRTPKIDLKVLGKSKLVGQDKGNSGTVDLTMTRLPFQVRGKYCSKENSFSVTGLGVHERPICKARMCGSFDVSGKCQSFAGDEGKGECLKTCISGAYARDMGPHSFMLAGKWSQPSVESFGKMSGVMLGKTTNGAAKYEYAAELSYIFAEDRTEMALAAGWSIDKKLSLKGRIDQEGKIAAMITQTVTPELAVGIGAQWDPVNLLQSDEKAAADKAPKIGLKFDLTF